MHAVSSLKIVGTNLCMLWLLTDTCLSQCFLKDRLAQKLNLTSVQSIGNPKETLNLNSKSPLHLGLVCLCHSFASMEMAKTCNVSAPASQEAQWLPYQSLGWEEPPGGGHGNPLQDSCLENPMDRGAWRLQSIGSERVRHNCSDLARARRHTHTLSPAS